MKINIPQDVQHIIDTLEKHKYDAYIVGGCVRDSIIGIEPKDWDITTNATPSEVISLFEYVLPTGEKHGTVTVMIGKEGYEVTTFRNDGSYSDGRRPDTVSFSNSIHDDLSRRDFTINAMAYKDGTLVDPYGGMSDISQKIVRCVGNADDRFMEDGLRILRCARFAGRYGFEIEEETRLSMNRNLYMLDNVSHERISKELKEIILNLDMYNSSYLTKILLKIIPELKVCVEFNQNNPYHSRTVYNHLLASVHYCDTNDYRVKLAMLLHDIGKPATYSEDENRVGHFYNHAKLSSKIAFDILKRLKFSNSDIKLITTLIELHDREISPTKKSIKKLLQLVDCDIIEKLLDVKLADIKAQSCRYYHKRYANLIEARSVLHKVIEENECISIKDLDINGNDIISHFNVSGKDVGIMLNFALLYILDNPSENNKENIISYLETVGIQGL